MAIVPQELTRQGKQRQDRRQRQRRRDRSDKGARFKGRMDQRRAKASELKKLIGSLGLDCCFNAYSYEVPTRRGKQFCRPALVVRMRPRLVLVEVVFPEGDANRECNTLGLRRRGHRTLVVKTTEIEQFRKDPQALKNLLFHASSK